MTRAIATRRPVLVEDPEDLRRQFDGELEIDPERVAASDERSWVFLAQDLEESAVSAHSPEEAAMAIERVALDEVPMLIQSGRLLDAKSIIGLCLAREVLM